MTMFIIYGFYKIAAMLGFIGMIVVRVSQQFDPPKCTSKINPKYFHPSSVQYQWAMKQLDETGRRTW